MSDTTAVRQIKVGRITGLSAYELAVKNGTFTGSEADFAKSVVENKTQLDQILAKLNEIGDKLDNLCSRLPDDISISLDEHDNIIFVKKD